MVVAAHGFAELHAMDWIFKQLLLHIQSLLETLCLLSKFTRPLLYFSLGKLIRVPPLPLKFGSPVTLATSGLIFVRGTVRMYKPHRLYHLRTMYIKVYFQNTFVLLVVPNNDKKIEPVYTIASERFRPLRVSVFLIANGA